MFKADKVFINGTIYTMEEEGRTVPAMAVYDGKIIETGTTEELLKFPAKEVIDLKGKYVLPGFIDTHCHVAEAVEGQLKVDLTGLTTIEAVLNKLTEALSTLEPGKWLIAYQISEKGIGRLPTRYELDEVSDKVPIFISENGFHSFMVNSALLKLMGVDKNFHQPGCEFIEKDENGEPTGILKEHGMMPYVAAAGSSIFRDDAHMEEMLKKKLADWSSLGYTTLHSCDGFSNSPMDGMAVYEKLDRKNELNMRMILNKQYAVDNELKAISGAGNDMVRYGAYKIFVDGSFSGRTALLTEDYADAPGQRGRSVRSYEEFFELVSHAYKLGNDLAIHVIGDRAVDWVIKSLEEIYDPESKQQIALIHISLTRPDQWEKLAKYPIVMETQPIFLPDMEFSSRVRLGEARGKHLMAYRSWMKHGLIVCGGEDGPIYTSNPFESMYFAVTRHIRPGVYLNRDEAISMYEALCMYTKNAAYCAHDEEKKGTITNGKLADFIVMDQDIFTLTPDEMRKCKVEQTYLGGRLVFQRDKADI